jgi:hypothetical protein
LFGGVLIPTRKMTPKLIAITAIRITLKRKLFSLIGNCKNENSALERFPFLNTKNAIKAVINT